MRYPRSLELQLLAIPKCRRKPELRVYRATRYKLKRTASRPSVIAMAAIAGTRGSLPKNISMKMMTFSIAAAVYSK
jgi:hypothetical protein